MCGYVKTNPHGTADARARCITSKMIQSLSERARARVHLQIIAAVFALIAAGLVVHLWRRRAVRGALPPGPRPWPIIGNLLELDAAAPHAALARLAGRYGPVFGLQLGGVYTVVLADAELIREALRSEALAGRAPLYVTHGIMGGFGEN